MERRKQKVRGTFKPVCRQSEIKKLNQRFILYWIINHIRHLLKNLEFKLLGINFGVKLK